MKISIIVPVYNGEGTIQKCLDSIIGQSYDNIEIIIVNDGSTDNTLEIINSYAQNHENITIISKENAGLPQARKTGVINATGDYIGFVDADDWIEKDMYAKLLNACLSHHADVSCCRICEDYGTGKYSYLGSPGELLFHGEEAIKAVLSRSNIFVYAWNKLFHADLLRNIEYPTGNFVGEDFYITTQVLEKTNLVVQIDDAAYHYIQVENSMCRGGYSENHVLAYNNYFTRKEILLERFPNCKKFIMNYLETEFLSFVIAMGKNNTYNSKMISDIKQFAKQNFRNYFFNSYVNLKYKISSVLFLINYKLLIKIYQSLV